MKEKQEKSKILLKYGLFVEEMLKNVKKGVIVGGMLKKCEKDVFFFKENHKTTFLLEKCSKL